MATLDVQWYYIYIQYIHKNDGTTKENRDVSTRAVVSGGVECSSHYLRLAGPNTCTSSPYVEVSVGTLLLVVKLSSVYKSVNEKLL